MNFQLHQSLIMWDTPLLSQSTNINLLKLIVIKPIIPEIIFNNVVNIYFYWPLIIVLTIASLQ